jgi:hypothetical protein
MQKVLKILLSLMFLLPLSPPAGAQQLPSEPLYLSYAADYGFILPHHQGMRHMTDMHFLIHELNVYNRTYGRKNWDALYRYPDKGLALIATDFSGEPELGGMLAVYPYLNFPLTRGERSALFFRFGAGLGWILRPFEAQTHYRNIAIGSGLNALIHGRYEYRFLLNRRLSLSAGISLTHLSNGAFRVPNLGINMVNVNAGISYRITHRELPERILPDKSRRKGWEYRLSVRAGLSEMYGPGGRKYPAFNMGFHAVHPITFNKKLGAGADMFYDTAIPETMRRKELGEDTHWNAFRPGINAVYILDFSRLHLLLQLGVYLRSHFKGDGMIYDRAALCFDVTPALQIELGLKTHLTQADMIELGFGWRFGKRN